VEGRLQGDSRPARRPPVRLNVAAAAAFFGALAVSAALSLVQVLPDAEDAIRDGSKLTPVERRHAAGDRLDLRSAPFDAFKARLRKRERYAVDVPPGERGPFITAGAVVRAYSAFYFLPAVQVPHAPVVFHYRFP
jgi:hypothetical protein